MPNRQFVRICPVNSVDGVDLEVPADVPIRSVLPDLLKVLDQPSSVHKKHLHYALKTEEDELLNEDKTFADAEIENFQTLWLTVFTNKTDMEEMTETEKAQAQKNEPAPENKVLPVAELPRGLRGIMSPLLWSQLPIENPSLVSPSGLIFELGERQMLIGRYCKDCNPAIDLSHLDKESVSSRKHAEIRGVKGKFILKALKTTNGTFVNGVKLNPGEVITLNDGDTIMFGLEGVILIFCLPKN
jgi:hypothetical protein